MNIDHKITIFKLHNIYIKIIYLNIYSNDTIFVFYWYLCYLAHTLPYPYAFWKCICLVLQPSLTFKLVSIVVMMLLFGFSHVIFRLDYQLAMLCTFSNASSSRCCCSFCCCFFCRCLMAVAFIDGFNAIFVPATSWALLCVCFFFGHCEWCTVDLMYSFGVCISKEKNLEQYIRW